MNTITILILYSLNTNLDNAKYINYVTTQNMNFLNVDLTAQDAVVNRRYAFSKPAADSDWQGVPTGRKGQQWLGVRDVYWLSRNHVLVDIFEAFPEYGAHWVTFFNESEWAQWQLYSSHPVTCSWQGNFASPELSGSVIPASIYIWKFPGVHIMNVKIDAKMESNNYQDDPQAPTGQYCIFNGDIIRQCANVAYYSFNTTQTHVDIVDVYNKIDSSTLEMYMGRTGLLLSGENNFKALTLSRAYTDNLATTGAWDATKAVYSPGMMYHMEIYGATYED